ncbi:hypothetical protein LSH36_361g04040, partial [Paralvinella palmiformis]
VTLLSAFVVDKLVDVTVRGEMVSFGISPSSRDNSMKYKGSADFNRPTPTTPRQKRLNRVNINRQSSAHIDHRRRITEFSGERSARQVLQPSGNLPVSQVSHLSERALHSPSPEMRPVSRIPQDFQMLPDSGISPASQISPPSRLSSSARRSRSSLMSQNDDGSKWDYRYHPLDDGAIQRRRLMLADRGNNFDQEALASGYQQLQPEARMDSAKDLTKRDALNSLEKRSTLKHFVDGSPTRADGPVRRVSFSLSHDDSAAKMSSGMATPRDTSEQSAPEVSPKRPQSAKHRKRGSSAEREKLSGVVTISDVADPKRPISSRPSKTTAAVATTRTTTTTTTTTIARARSSRGRPSTRDSPAIEGGASAKRDSSVEEAVTVDTDAIIKNDSIRSSVVGRTVGDKPFAAGLDEVDVMARYNSATTDQANQNPLHSRSSLIHNVSLATKVDSQKNCLVELTMADKVRNMEYLCISCHDWSCSCNHPDCVTRYDFREGQKHFESFGPVKSRKDFILPEGCRLISGEVTSGTPTKQRNRHMMANHLKVHGNDYEKGTTSERDELDLRRRMELSFAHKPISVQRAFRVFGPHWASRSHTQRWPWRGTTWVSVCGDEVTNSRSRRQVK